MLFGSFEFLFVFLPTVLAGFYFIGRSLGRLAALGWLLLASMVFYASWKLEYLWILFASILFNYSLACLIGVGGRFKKSLLMFSLAGNIFLLLYYKVLIAGYFDSARVTTAAFSTTEDLLIPLAISFITFQQIAFLVDTYKGGIRKVNWVEYSLFISFFPQLLMGPIVHYRELVPQFRLSTLCVWRWDNIAVGFSIFTVGLFKKVVLADGISPYVDSVYSAVYLGHSISPLDAFGAAIGFSLQLYFDFSGYADMAVGLGRIFNINLPINFDSPFRAVNRFDYWRRWHISFGAFMRQYLFFPLARSKKLKVGRIGALILTVFVSSIWHGLGPTFIVWGGLQGLFLLAVHFRRHVFQYLNIRYPLRFFSPWGSVLLTFFTTVMLGVFFRAKDITSAFSIFDNMHRGFLLFMDGEFSRIALESLISRIDIAMIIVMSVIVWGLPNTRRLFSSYWAAIDQRPKAPGYTPADLLPGASKLYFSPKIGWAVCISVMLFAALVSMQTSVRFIYFQF
jgi:D-alanyl-lipoteichoic acid acyltransferase DltB (MBOAT superfamily)